LQLLIACKLRAIELSTSCFYFRYEDPGWIGFLKLKLVVVRQYVVRASGSLINHLAWPDARLAIGTIRARRTLRRFQITVSSNRKGCQYHYQVERFQVKMAQSCPDKPL
jgi:hypothetical protein